MTKHNINFNLNGKPVCLAVDPAMRLIDLLREELGLTGSKEGCGIGECGACTVILDNQAVNSCLILAGQLEGCSLLTIEGLAQNGELDILQQAFYNQGAIQCGYCTPGMIMSAKALLLANPNPTKEQIKNALAGNICRCSDYSEIANAVEAAAQTLGGANDE